MGRDAEAFLREIFEPDDEMLDGRARITIWRSTSKDSRHVASVTDAAELIDKPGWRNVSFFGVCARSGEALRRAARESGRAETDLQGSREAIGWFPGVWVDVDIDEPGKDTKKTYPPSRAAALDAITRAVPEAPPTITVDSGGGLHLYWLFAEGLVETLSESDGRRGERELLVRQYQAMIRDEFMKQGWDLDPTWACTRVLRVPGTMNAKYEPPRPVSWELTGPRYSIEELETRVPGDLNLGGHDAGVVISDEELRFELPRADEAWGIRVDATIREIIDTADIDGSLAPVWRATGRGANYDQSANDMSLVSRLLHMGVSQQVAVDAARRHRLRLAPMDEKAHRADYYERTVRKVLAGLNKDRAVAERTQDVEQRSVEIQRASAEVVRLNEQLVEASKSGAEESAEEIRGEIETKITAAKEAQTKMLDHLNELLDLKGQRRVTDVSRSASVTTSRSMLLLSFGGLGATRAVPESAMLSCAALRVAIQSATHEIIPPFSTKKGKPRQWAPVAKALLALVVELGEDEVGELPDLLWSALEDALLPPMPMAAPHTPGWHDALPRREGPVLWWLRPTEEAPPVEETGLLVPAAWILEWAQRRGLDRLLRSGVSQRAISAMFERLLPGVEAVPAQSYKRAGSGARSTVKGYVRVRYTGLPENLQELLARKVTDAVWS